ncbi:MAG: sigma-70 family RNA polymerase sigma factor, partial [Bacteroides sp.]|nr:sigma-70 family RNA polymerase sigma factor [Bacteroides sp.]
TSTQLIADSYERYHRSVYLYIYYRINQKEEAEDLSQDVYLRLMDYKPMLRLDTVKFFIFTIARNLVNDWLRRYYKAQEITSYLYDQTARSTNDTEDRLMVRDLMDCERGRMRLLPPQRRKVYALNRFQGKSSAEIAERMSLSRRTVENHLLISRKEVRNYIKQCI